VGLPIRLDASSSSSSGISLEGPLEKAPGPGRRKSGLAARSRRHRQFQGLELALPLLARLSVAEAEGPFPWGVEPPWEEVSPWEVASSWEVASPLRVA